MADDEHLPRLGEVLFEWEETVRYRAKVKMTPAARELVEVQLAESCAQGRAAQLHKLCSEPTVMTRRARNIGVTYAEARKKTY